MPSGFGGFVRGAAAVAVPMILEQEKEKQIAARDARLAALQTERDKQVQGAQAAENKLNRDAASEDARLGREHSENLAMTGIAAQQATAAREYEQEERKIGIQSEQVGMAKAQHERNMELLSLQIDEATEAGANRKEIKSLQNDAISASKAGDIKQVTDLLNQIRIRSGRESKYSLGREQMFDAEGYPIPDAYRTIIIDTSSGEATYPSVRGGGILNNAQNDPLGIRGR